MKHNRINLKVIILLAIFSRKITKIPHAISIHGIVRKVKALATTDQFLLTIILFFIRPKEACNAFYKGITFFLKVCNIFLRNVTLIKLFCNTS